MSGYGEMVAHERHYTGVHVSVYKAPEGGYCAVRADHVVPEETPRIVRSESELEIIDDGTLTVIDTETQAPAMPPIVMRDGRLIAW